MTRLYIAGPMTGRPRWNFDAFAAAARALRAAGYEVTSPHEADLERGFDPDAPVEEFTREHLLKALERDAIMVLRADGVALLDGWADSKGATAEAALAVAAGIRVRHLHAWIGAAE